MNKKRSLIFIYIIILLIFILFFLRLLSPKEIDDVSPEIPCKQELFEKVDILWIIPKFNNIPISENKTWCDYILSLNKTLGLHGITHQYEEFQTDRSQKYLQGGINLFKECFGYLPQMFKPPQLKISENNKALIKANNLTLKLNSNQIIHKVYHCNDSDIIKNWFVDFF